MSLKACLMSVFIVNAPLGCFMMSFIAEITVEYWTDLEIYGILALMEVSSYGQLRL